MILKNWWLRGLQGKATCPKLSKDITTEYLVIGGGIAGLHAALYLANLKRDVVLLEKSFCGGSSSGKSSGFLTPASELGLGQMVKRYGVKDAKVVWEIPMAGVAEMKKNIEEYKIRCDVESQDCLYVGLGDSGFKEIKNEVDGSKKMGVKYRFYDKKALKSALNTEAYNSGIRTFNTYSINSLKYCQEMKKVLLKKGVKIYENSGVLKIKGDLAETQSGSVEAKKIIVCIDKMKSALGGISKEIYHAQTYLAISRPLSKKEIKSIFPSGGLMCWDSRLLYSYFRLTKDKRLLLGGSSEIVVYSPGFINSSLIINSVIKDFKDKFPQAKNIKFVAYWPGLIDIAKDIMPIVDFDKKNKNVQYVLGNPGLPWAAFFGTYAAKRATNRNTSQVKKYEKYVKANRKFFISDFAQNFMGKIPSFALNNLYTEYYQVDRKL